MEIYVLNRLNVGNLLFQRIRKAVEKKIRDEQLIHIETSICLYNSEKQRVFIPEFDEEVCFETFDCADSTLVAYRFINKNTGQDTLVYANEVDVEALAGY